MKKELPKVFPGSVSNDNNMSFSKSSDRSPIINDNRPVREKINAMFSSLNYVYKIDAVININGDIVTKQLVGRNKDYLITMDNEQIKIDDINDINIK